jgi:hypothetical protein
MGEPTAKLLGDYVVDPLIQFANERLFPEHTRTGDYASDQWKEWYEKSGLHGTQEFLEHQDFIAQAAPRLQQRLEEWDSEMRPYSQSTPVDAYGNSLDPDNPAEVILRQNAIDALLGRPYNRDNADSMRFLQEFLDHMRDTSLGGPLSQDTSATPEQFAQMREETGAFNVDNRLTPGGAEAMARLKDYNLFTAFQMGNHKPGAMELPFMSGPLGVAGVMYGNMTGEALNPVARGQASAAFNPSPLNAMRSVMAWDDRGRETDPNMFRDYLTGANIPQASIMDPLGLERSFNTGDTAYGRATRQLTNAILMPGESTENRDALAQVMNDRDRFTPISQPGAFEADQKLVEQGRRIEAENWARPATYLPMLIREFNKLFGAGAAAYAGTTPEPPPGMKYEQSDNPYIPARLVPLSPEEQQYQDLRRQESSAPAPRVDPDPYSKIGITPFYGTQALNDLVATAPNFFGDPGNIAASGVGGAVSALANMARGAGVGRSLGSAAKTVAATNVADLPGETAFQTGVSMAITPQTPFEYFTEPSPQIPLQRDSAGNLPLADSTKYIKGIADLENRRESGFEQMRKKQDSDQQEAIRRALFDTAPTSLFPGSSPTALKPFRSPLSK